jgi:hypothetical protein
MLCTQTFLSWILTHSAASVQIEQFQKENEVLRMVLAQVCRMRGDPPDAWNDLVTRLREPSPMLSDNHAMQMAASALSASQVMCFLSCDNGLHH